MNFHENRGEEIVAELMDDNFSVPTKDINP